MQWQCWMSILHGLTSWNVFPRVIFRRPRWCQIGGFAIGWICHFFYPESSKSVSFLRKLELYSSFRLKSSTALYTATNFMMKRPGIIRAFSLNHFYRFTFTLEKCDRNLHTAFFGVFGASPFVFVALACGCGCCRPRPPFSKEARGLATELQGQHLWPNSIKMCIMGCSQRGCPPPRKMKVNTPKMNILNPSHGGLV